MAPLPRAAAATAKPAVQKAAQRYLNKASGKMETAQQIHTYRAPAPKPVPPAGHNTSGTTHTVTRTVVTTPKAPVSFINKTPAEVENTARKLTEAEVSGVRAAYAPSQSLLGQEQQGALNAHATSYGQLGTTIQGLQTQQAANAKTYENYAADAINSAQTAAPGAVQSAERAGLKPGEALSPALQQQQENARTLLSGIAQAGAAGTNARQANEANLLTNDLTSAALGTAEGAKNIEGQYGLRKGTVTEKEGAAIAKAQGNQATLAQKLFGEQEKLREAATGLGYKGQEVANKTASTTSKVTSERSKEVQGAQKNATAERKLGAEEKYKNSTIKQKNAVDKANIEKTEAATVKLLNETQPGGGKPLTTSEKNTIKGETAYIFQALQRAREAGIPLATARAELERGSYNRVGFKYNAKGEKVQAKETVHTKAIKNTLMYTVAEQSIEHGYVNAATKQQLREAGMNDSGWSNLLYSQAGEKRPVQNAAMGVRGGVNAGGKTKAKAATVQPRHPVTGKFVKGHPSFPKGV